MADVPQDHLREVREDPRFSQLVAVRRRLAVRLTLVMLAVYFGFVLVVAFAPGLLAVRLGDGVTTLGIPVGVAVIVTAFALTGVYVHRANHHFDRLERELRRGRR